MSSPKYLNACLIAVLLSACAHAPQTAVTAEPKAEQAAHEVAPVAEADLPKQELTREWLYEYLISEIGSQRGYRGLAVEGSAELARQTRDPRLVKRAAQLAFESGDMEKSLQAFRLWHEVEPNATLPSRMTATLLLREGKLAEAQTEFAQVLQHDAAEVPHVLLQIGPMLADYPDKAAALQSMRELAAPYPNVAEAHATVANLARSADQPALAMDEIKQARKLRPDWDMAAGLEASLLQKTAPQQGLQVLKDFLEGNPDAHELRLQYARALVEQQQFAAAREQFRRVAANTPDNPDLAFAIALLSLQMNDLQGAEDELKNSLGKGDGDQNRLHYYLGQLSEAKKQDDAAMAHYRQVNGGDNAFAAKMRVAILLAKQGKLEEARQGLRDYTPVNNEQRVQVTMIEAQLLRDAKQYESAYQVLQQGLDKLPAHKTLLYETAMMADKTGRYALAEQDLRKLMSLDPQDASAYNALGYSMLERNERVPEAVTLVEKALQLSPNDASIMDSVGWGYYRSGKLDESVSMLRKAFAQNPDPEIASHLGEVLWMHGDKAEAAKFLQDNLKSHPDNELLQAAARKFTL